MALFSRLAKKLSGTVAPGQTISFPPVAKEKAREEGPFAGWIRNHRVNPKNEKWCRAQAMKFTYRPTIGILMECKDPKIEFLQESLASIFNQVYPFHELFIVDRGSSDSSVKKTLEDLERDLRVKVFFQKGSQRDIEAIAKVMKKAVSEWILPMSAEDLLEPITLYNMVAVLQDTVEIDFVYSDSDLIDNHGLRFDPQFKPVWAVGASYPLGYYQHPVLLHDRLIKKLKGHERVSALMEEGTLLDEASNHSRYVLQAPGILYHGRARGLKNEKAPEPADNVLINENYQIENAKIKLDPLRRIRTEPRVPLKILWAIDSLDVDDGELVWYHYLRYLTQQSKHQFTVFSLKDGPMKAIYEKICPVTVAAADPAALKATIAKLHAGTSYDVAFVSSVENIWFPDALKELEIPAVWQLYPGSASFERADLEKKFQYPATILFLNSAIAAQYKDIDTRGVSRILATGVDLADIKLFRQCNSPALLREKLEITKTSTVITIAGPTVPRKGQKFFVEAATKLLSQGAKELDFFIVGATEGAYLLELQEMVRKSGRAERFHFVPASPDPLQYYPYIWVSDFCVSCSTQETFPLAVLEAMAFKKAVIGSNVFSTNEVMEDEENGYLYDDLSGLCDRMQLLVEKPDLREALARRSLEIVYEKFQFKKIVGRLEDLLRETIIFE